MIEKVKILELYRMVSLIRQVELKIVEVYPTDIMQCPVHLSVGQESIAAAVCAHLGKDDPAIGTHRGHALYIAKGGNIQALFAELLGRVDGCSGGYGGSMHLIDLSCGLLGTSSIVGGSLPIAVGFAVGMTLPNIACVMFGDGASDEGIFYECLNFASLKKLPLLFICENNRYSVYTHSDHRRSSKPHKIAEACGVKSVYAPIEVANDTWALYNLLGEYMDALRNGEGPLFFECDTVRAYDHNGIRDDVAAGIRPQIEAELFERYCPLKLMKNQIEKNIAETIDKEISEEVNISFNAALESKPLNIGTNYEQLGDDSCFTGFAGV